MLSSLVQAQFREMEGGYHRANVELKAYLRDGWVLPALPALVEESAAALGEGASETARDEHALLCRHVGSVLKDNGQLGPALAHHEMELEIRLALEGPESTSVAACYQFMGFVHDRMREYDRALELHGQATAIWEVKDPDSTSLAGTYCNLGLVHYDQKDHARALERYGQAAAILEANEPGEFLANTYGAMANVYGDQKDYSKSLEYHRKALAIKERVHGPRHPSTAGSHHNMGTVFEAQGDHAAALEAYGKALAIYEQVLGPQSEQTISTRKAKAKAERALA
eukprot:COSAG04_NODE_274_length_18488_cov_35.031377_18_plen_283_part_00